jgi:hypothetical protein
MEDHFSLRITERSRSSEQMRGNEDLFPLFESTEQRRSPRIGFVFKPPRERDRGYAE